MDKHGESKGGTGYPFAKAAFPFFHGVIHSSLMENTQLDGAVSNAGAIICVGSYDANYNALSPICL